jgi:hypothetical protein
MSNFTIEEQQFTKNELKMKFSYYNEKITELERKVEILINKLETTRRYVDQIDEENYRNTKLIEQMETTKCQDKLINGEMYVDEIVRIYHTRTIEKENGIFHNTIVKLANREEAYKVFGLIDKKPEVGNLVKFVYDQKENRLNNFQILIEENGF